MKRSAEYADLEDLLALHRHLGERVRRRLEDFAAVNEEEYFFELLYCLLTPQSSARSAAKAVETLRTADRWDDPVYLSAVLGDRAAYIRFHHTKARRIVEARRLFPAIRQHMAATPEAEEQRRWLVSTVPGLGWKEASHFLRNIGRRNLAILDRHILKNLFRHRVLSAPIGTLTARRYVAVEQEFRHFGATLGISIDELDLLFWSRETGEILK